MTRIGTLADQFTIHMLTQAALVGTTVYAAPLYEPGRIALFDFQSRTSRTIGRPGKGPGEFGFVWDLVPGAGGKLFVFEDARVTVLSNYDSVLQVLPIQLTARKALALPDGSFVFNSIVRTPNGVGLPLHLVDRNGRILASFGDSADSVPRSYTNPAEADAYIAGATIDRDLAHGKAGFFWSAHQLRYQIDLWRTDRTLVRRLVRDADWFPPRSNLLTTAPWSVPPKPFLIAVHQDSHNRLWVASWVADANWRARPANEYTQAGARDTIIEVIDLTSNLLLSSTRIPGAVTGFLADSMIVSQEEDESGLVFLKVSRIQLHGR